MRCRIIVVIWSVSVCLSVCVTTNLGIYADKRQMMGSSGISGVWRSLKKVFSLKMHHSKVMASFTYCDSVNDSTAYLRRRSLLRKLKRLMRCSILLEVGVNN